MFGDNILNLIARLLISIMIFQIIGDVIRLSKPAKVGTPLTAALSRHDEIMMGCFHDGPIPGLKNGPSWPLFWMGRF